MATYNDYDSKSSYGDTLSKERARKTVKAIMTSVNSQVEKHEISNVFTVYKQGDNFHFQTVEKFVALTPNAAYSMSARDKLRQALIQLIDAINALEHNIFFINVTSKMGQTIKVKERNSDAFIEQFVDLEYLNTVKFINDNKALEYNERKTISRAIPLFSPRQDVPEEDKYLVDKWNFINCLAHTLAKSKELVLNLHARLEKSGYQVNELIINHENKLFEKVDNMIDGLKTGKIEVEGFRIELVKQCENNINY